MYLFKSLMQWILIFTFTTHSVTWGTLMSEGKIQEADAVFKASHLESFAVEYNKKMKNLDTMLKVLEMYYPKKDDAEYLKLAYKETNKSQFERKSATITTKGRTVQLTLPNAMIVNIEQIADNLIKINGRDFKLDLNKPLKDTHLEINKILEETLLKKNKFSIYNFILPEAHAFWPILLFAGLFIVLPVGAYLVLVNDIEDNLKEALKVCQNRDSKVAFNNSEIYEKLQYLKAKSIYTIEKQREIRDCASWAKSGYEQAQRQGRVSSVVELTKLCLLGEKLMKCVDEYQAASKTTGVSGGGGTQTRSGTSP